jgi:hypothetical protein
MLSTMLVTQVRLLMDQLLQAPLHHHQNLHHLNQLINLNQLKFKSMILMLSLMLIIKQKTNSLKKEVLLNQLLKNLGKPKSFNGQMI